MSLSLSKPELKRAVSSAAFELARKRPRKAARMAPRLLNSMVRKAIGNAAEAKEVVNQFTQTFNATKVFTTCLNLLTEGTEYNNRVGRSVTHKYVEVSIGLVNSLANTSTAITSQGDYGFWAIVLDRQPNQGLATFSTIFDESDGLGNRITYSNQDRFKIICREEWSIGGNFQPPTAANGGTGAVPYHIHKWVDLSRMQGRDGKAKYTGNAGTIADLDEGAILFVMGSTLTTATANTVLTANIKYRYTDM